MNDEYIGDAPKQQDNAEGLTRRQTLERRRSALESDRSSFMTLWRMLNDYILPTRGRFVSTDNNRGDRRSKNILDSTATLAARTLSSGMMSGITSPARPWFRLTTPDPDMAEFASVKTWLYTCTERIRWALARSNFYNKAPLVYQDMGVFATGGLLQLEDDHSITRFYDLPVGSFCTALDESNRPGLLTREFQMTVYQLVQRFGVKACTRHVQDAYRRGNLETLIEVVHFVHQNSNMKADAMYAKEHAYYSCYYEKNAPYTPDSQAFLRESGFREFPVTIPRWEVTGEDVYGTNSPGITALGDIKQLQAAEKMSLQAVEKMIKPPLVGPTALKHVRVSILPSDITYVDTREGQQGLRPIHELRFDVNSLEAKQAQCRGRIERSFFADLFLMLSTVDAQSGAQRDMTAAEIYERHEEKLLALGPVLEQLNQDFLDPIVDRTFNILERRGFIPLPPPELEGVSLQTEYISIMHQAQKATSLQGLRSTVEFVLMIADKDPSALDKLDTDKIIDHAADAAGIPPDVIKPQDQVDAVRQARAAAAAEQQAAENTQRSADAAKKLSETNTRQPSALSDLAQASSTGGVLPTGVTP